MQILYVVHNRFIILFTYIYMYILRSLLVVGENKMDWEGSDTIPTKAEVTQKQYDCGICSQTSPSTDENPIGLVILVQVKFYFAVKLVMKIFFSRIPKVV